jgi:hypothetical protein
MNCSEFEACLVDLVADRTSTDLVRTEARSHASTCPRCAARMAEEQGLVTGLRAWATKAQHETAPAHVEAALLTRFRELERAKAAVPDIQAPEQASWKAHVTLGWQRPSVVVGLGADSIHSRNRCGSSSTSARNEGRCNFSGEGGCYLQGNPLPGRGGSGS